MERIGTLVIAMSLGLGCGNQTLETHNRQLLQRAEALEDENEALEARIAAYEAQTDTDEGAADDPGDDSELDDEEGELQVTAGACGTSFLPSGLAIDLSDDDESALLEAVRAWLAGQGGPGLDYGNGTLFAKSEDDTGMDPPHPTSVGRGAERACGNHQIWLRDRALALLAFHASPDYGGVRCADNVCCYDAPMEFASSGTFTFTRSDGGRWLLRSVAIVADNGTLGEEWVAAERAWVTAALTRQMRGRCAGEPQIAW